MEITRILARYAVEAKLADIPAPVVHEAARALVHWMGCAVGGCRAEPVETALATVDEFSGPRVAHVLGRMDRLDILNAALVNGISSDALAFTDTHLKTVLHPGGVVGPAALAVAERQPVTGEALLAAFLVGIEVACRIGVAVYTWHYGRGWHITGTVGTFGAAAAAGRLLGLDEERMAHALGLAATQAAGLRAMFGSMTKSFHGGHAAHAGLFSALLAARGFTASTQGIEARRGFAHVLGDEPDLAAAVEGLGTRFEVLDNTYKPFPCGVVIHPAIDGCITLKAEHSPAPESIERVVLRVHPLVLELCGRKTPQTTSEAKLSVFHSAAAALIAGRVTGQEYAPARVKDAALIALRDRVVAEPDDSIREDEAHVTVELAGGRRLVHHVEHAIGSAARPMSDRDIDAKFRGLAEPVLPAARIERLLAACWSVRTLPDAAELARLATP